MVITAYCAAHRFVAGPERPTRSGIPVVGCKLSLLEILDPRQKVITIA
jgi:hypothetical protein